MSCKDFLHCRVWPCLPQSVVNCYGYRWTVVTTFPKCGLPWLPHIEQWAVVHVGCYGYYTGWFTSLTYITVDAMVTTPWSRGLLWLPHQHTSLVAMVTHMELMTYTTVGRLIWLPLQAHRTWSTLQTRRTVGSVKTTMINKHTELNFGIAFIVDRLSCVCTIHVYCAITLTMSFRQSSS